MDKQTDIKIGFKTNTQELKKASEGVRNLQRDLKGLKDAEGVGAIKSPLGRIRNYVTGSGGSRGGIGQAVVQRGFRGGMRGVATGLGALGLAGGFIGVMAKSIAMGKEFTETTGNMVKALDLGVGAFDTLAGKIGDHAEALRIGMNELARYEKAYMRVAGIQGGAMSMMRQVKTAGGLARGYGLDVGETVSQFGSLAQAGAFGQMGSISAKEFSMYLAEAINNGGMRGRENEVLQSFQSIAESQLGVLTRIENMGFFSDLLTGMNKTGQPGLMGMRGASLLTRLDAGLRNPNGELGELMMWQAMGGADKNKNYFKFKYREEGGLQNLGAVQNWMKKQEFTPYEEAYYASQMLGVSMHQYQGVGSAMGKLGKSREFSKFLKNAGITGDNEEIMGVMNQVYNSKDKKEMEMNLITSNKFTKKGISSILEGGNKADILRRMSQASLNLNPVDEQSKAFAMIENNLTKTGTVLISGLAASVNLLTEGIKSAAETFVKLEAIVGRLKNSAGDFADTVVDLKDQAAGNSKGKYHATALLGSGFKSSARPVIVIEDKTVKGIRASNGNAPQNATPQPAN